MARRIERASQEVEKIRAMVDTGVAPKIRLDAAERDLEDTRDKIILDGAVSDYESVAAAQRRLDRQKAWTEKIRKLSEGGIAPPADMIPAGNGTADPGIRT